MPAPVFENAERSQMIPSYVSEILRRLDDAGYEGWLVGGCVRDMLMGRSPGDWDVASNALPPQLRELFGGAVYENGGERHGTVAVNAGGSVVEITTYRVDGQYIDHRRPQSVRYVSSLIDDLARRDLTVNAMAYRPDKGIIDPFGGQDDLRQGILRAVGDPQKRFGEDALRILRAVRFCSQLGFEPEKKTAEAMELCAPDLMYISGERIFSELKRIIMGPNALHALLRYGDVVAHAVPALAPSVGFDQQNHHHIYDVWEHSIRALASVGTDDMCLRLALLFHDTGKPASFTVDHKGEGHFYGHAMLSAEITRDALTRLKCDRHTLEEVIWLVHMHDMTVTPDMACLAKLIVRYGAERVKRLLIIKIADNSAQSPRYGQRGKDAAWLLERLREIEREGRCLSIAELAVDGGDMIEAGLKGRAVGDMLERLLYAALTGVCENSRASLMAWVYKTR